MLQNPFCHGYFWAQLKILKGIANTKATGTTYITHMTPAGWALATCMSCVTGTKEQGPPKGGSLSPVCAALLPCRNVDLVQQDYRFFSAWKNTPEILIFKCDISRFENIGIQFKTFKVLCGLNKICPWPRCRQNSASLHLWSPLSCATRNPSLSLMKSCIWLTWT